MSVKEEKPTKFRWLIMLLLCTMYLLSYLDRVCISVAAPAIREEFGFDKVTMGFIFSAFTWGYALLQVVGGWMGDRFGPRKILAGLVAFWSLMTCATALCGKVSTFVAARFLFGLGCSGAFPTATRAMQLWYPREERGIGQGLTHAASRFAAAIVPPIVVVIMLQFGWRTVFYGFGALGLVFALVWYIMYRDLPEDSKHVNHMELARIRGVDAAGNVKSANVAKKPKMPWGVLLRHPNMWAIMVCDIAYCYCLWMFLAWLPAYLVEYRGFTLVKMGIFAMLPMLAGAIGDTLGGWLTDYLLAKTKSTKIARRSVAIMAFLGGAFFLASAGMATDPYVAVGCLTGAMLFLECAVGPIWAVPMDVGGEYSGTVSGLMNTAGCVGGAISPIAFGLMVQYGSWNLPFIVAPAILIAAALGWAFWLNPEVSVVDKGWVLSESAKAAKAGSGK